MPRAPYLLGIDCGLTSVKVVVFDRSGRAQGQQAAPTPVRRGAGGRVELDPDALWRLTGRTVRRALARAGLRGEAVGAVGVSGHGNGLYLIDPRGTALGPAILPMDERAAALVREWGQSGTSEAAFPIALQRPWAGQPAPLLRWLKRHDRRRYDRIGSVLSCKDWITHQLTGTVATDYGDISAGGLFDNRRGRYSDALLAAYGLEDLAGALPPVRHAGGEAGRLTAAAARQTGLRAGTPVAVGLFDVDACCVGSGVMQPGCYAVIAGTWSINAALRPRPLASRRITQCTLFADGAQHLCIDSSATSLANLEWFLASVAPRRLRRQYAACDAIAAAVSLADTPDAFFLPFIHPSFHYPQVRAGFLGLTPGADWRQMLRLVYEGIAFGHRLHVDALRACGLRCRGARLSGGVAHSPVWRHLLADVLNLPLETTRAAQPGALGAALAAGVASGVYPTLEAAVTRTVRVDHLATPQPRRAAAFESRYARFRGLVESLQKEGREGPDRED